MLDEIQPCSLQTDNPGDIPDGHTLLRYQFQKGKELRWNVEHTLKMRNIIGGVEENIETRSRAVKIWTTIDVEPDGAGVFEYRVEDIDIHQSQTGHDDILYNSIQDATIPPEFNNLQGKIGVPLAHIRICPQGQTTRKPLREYAGSISENRIVIPLPSESVGVGSRWAEPNQIELPQPNQTIKRIRSREEFLLEGLQSGLALIQFNTLIFTPLTPKEESQLLDYFSHGSMELDLQSGNFVRHQATTDRFVVGVQEASDSIRYLSRVVSCCCGRRACSICRV